MQATSQNILPASLAFSVNVIHIDRTRFGRDLRALYDCKQ